MRELIEAYNVVVQIIYPKRAWYIFPGYLQYAVYRRYMKYFKDKYRLVPLPNNLYEQLIKNEYIKSEHILFASQELYEEYAESEEVNFVNMTISCGKTGEHEDTTQNGSVEGDDSQSLVKQILKQSPHTMLVQILPVKYCKSDCIFVQVRKLINDS